MKTTYAFLLLLLFSLQSCNTNDDGAPPEIELQNEPPLSFNLLNVSNNATEVDLTPTLSWESAKNPAGSEVTYDLYLGTEKNPSNLYQLGITETSVEIKERLDLITEYYWKVVATDPEGKKSQSPIQKFTTRYYVIPDEPLFAEGGFGARFDHANTVFNNRIWLTGGTEEEVNEDVISTPDGLAYTFHHESGGFIGYDERFSHEMLTYDNKLWVISGRQLFGPSAVKEDVWYSEDGLIWNQAIAKTAFGGKVSFGATVFDDKMWVIAGNDENFDRTNDVWYSQDGFVWIQTTNNAGFSKRSGHAVVTFKDKLWVIGGFDGERKNDVWCSSDGIKWVEATSEAAFPARNAHTATVFDNKIWIVGGIVGETANTANDVWYSDDGINWKEVEVSDSFPTIAQHTAAVFNDQLWIIGGTGSGFGNFNNIWTLD